MRVRVGPHHIVQDADVTVTQTFCRLNELSNRTRVVTDACLRERNAYLNFVPRDLPE
jgi:hypothetical protein